MSHEASYWAIRQTGISPTAKLVLMVLADYHNRADGGCFPAIQTLADICCCDEKTVKRAVNELCLAGLVDKNTRHDESGRQRSNQYNLRLSQTGEGGNLTPSTPPNLTPLEPVTKNHTNTSYLHDPLLSTFDNQSDEPPLKIPEKARSFWDGATGGLLAMGLEENHARRMIGRWLKQTNSDQAAITRAIDAALEQGTLDPIPYISAVLGEKHRDKKKEVNDAFAEILAASDKRKAEWAAQGLLGEGNDTGSSGGTDHGVLQPEPHTESVYVPKKRGRRPRKVSVARPPEIVRPIGGYLGALQVRADDS